MIFHWQIIFCSSEKYGLILYKKEFNTKELSLFQYQQSIIIHFFFYQTEKKKNLTMSTHNHEWINQCVYKQTEKEKGKYSSPLPMHCMASPHWRSREKKWLYKQIEIRAAS